jgi:CubicO group peptidase (beta-lactamase class C family)
MTEHRRTALTRREMLGVVGSTALAAGVHPIAHRPPAPRPAVPQPATRDFSALLAQARVPSVSVATVDGDRVTTFSSGIRRKGEVAEATPDTIYAAASLTKMTFSYAFLGLVVDGLVDLDRPLTDVIPIPDPTDVHARAITARRLLGHTGGWRNWRNNMEQRLTSDFEPGSRWSYSGEGFFYLQRIAEQLTGKGTGRLLRERVFDPLAMTRTSIVPLESNEPHHASGHDSRGEPVNPFGRPQQIELRRAMLARGLTVEDARVEDAEAALRTADARLPVLPNFFAPNAAASMVTTAADFGRFLAHLVNARAAGGRAGAIVDLMFTPQIRCNPAVQWGLGVGLEEVQGRQCAWQWGDNPGFKHYAYADPGAKRAMVVLTNGDRGARVYERVIRTLSGIDRPGFLWA